MKVLHKFVIKSYVGPMVLTFFIVLFIMILQFLWLYIDEIVGRGLSWIIIFELIGWASVTFIPMALPLSTLLASIMTMGNLGENNELLAIKAAGISLQRILRPLFILVFVVVVIGGFFASNNLIPHANLKFRSLLYDVRKTRNEFSIPEGIFYNGMPDYTIRIDKKSNETNLLKNIMIYDHTKRKGNTSLTLADSGYIKQAADQEYLLLTLYSGRSYEEELQNGRFSNERDFSRRWFDEQTMLISLGNMDFTRSDETLFADYAQMQNIIRLNQSYDSLSTVQNERTQTLANQVNHSTLFFDQTREFDTIIDNRAKFQHGISIDSIFESKSVTDKLPILDRALQKIGNAKSHLINHTGEYEQRRKQIANVQIEWHRKFALSVACIIFFFIGAPLGAIVRKGGLGMPVVISILFFVVYWVIDISCRKMALSGNLNPALATWMSSIVLAPIGIFLTYKSTSDSSLFNADSYIEFFNKLFGRMKKLVIRVNLDDIEPVKERLSVYELETEILELNNLCHQFAGDYKLNKNFLWSASKFSMSDGGDKLHYITNKYNRLLSNLITIDNNERLRGLLRQYPVLNEKDYKLSNTSFNSQALRALIRFVFIIFFPIGLVLYIIILNRRKKLRYILNEIVEINNTASITITKNE